MCIGKLNPVLQIRNIELAGDFLTNRAGGLIQSTDSKSFPKTTEKCPVITDHRLLFAALVSVTTPDFLGLLRFFLLRLNYLS